MKKIDINLIPNTVNMSPDYYCTWQTQLYATCDGKPAKQREIVLVRMKMEIHFIGYITKIS